MKLALIKKPVSTTPPADLTAYRAELKATPFDAKIEELRGLLRDVEAQILEAEGTERGESISPDQQKIHARVQALLGEPASDKPLRNWEGLLESLRLDRDAIKRAIEILGEKRTIEIATRITAEIEARRQEWDDLQLEKALTEIKLRDIERRCENYKTSLVGTGARFPCDVPLSRAMNTGEIQRHLAATLHEGLISQKEFKP